MPFGILDPIVSKQTIKPYQDMIDYRTADMSVPEAQLRGFGAGAMEGARQLTSPAVLGLMGLMGMAAGIPAAAPVAMASAPAAQRFAQMPAEFSKSVGPMAARMGLPAEFGGAAYAGPEPMQGLQRAMPSLPDAASRISNWIGKTRY